MFPHVAFYLCDQHFSLMNYSDLYHTMDTTNEIALGGYEYEFLNPDHAEEQKCPICFLVVRDAYQVNCCGKIMCESCLMRLLQGCETCPMCRDNIGDKYFKDTKSDQSIKSLRLFCSYRSAGCEWNGELRNVEEHLNDCLYQDVECEDCNETVLKLHLQTHKTNECPERRYKCPLCKEEETYRSITTTHTSECPEAIVECQNTGCTVSVKRSELPLHTEVCPKQIVQCPFNHMGCGFQSERDKLPVHIEKRITSHVDLVAQHVQIYHRVAPVIIKMSDFERSRQLDKKWHSNGFYTGLGGHKVRLQVFPNGYGDGKSSYISVYINLMPGANDDILQYPLRGKFTVELLNQIEDGSHHRGCIMFDSKASEKNACSRKYQLDEHGWGICRFIRYSSLGIDTTLSTQYLQNDTVYFRITADICSQTKPWLNATL